MSWDWEIFLQDPGGEHTTYLGWLMSAWGWTLSVSLLALLLALLMGFVIGTLRTLPKHPAWVLFGSGWTELFRNIPLLLQIFLWYHVIPALIPPLKELSGFILVVLALGFFTSARISEQVYSGIRALPKGQFYAAQALGMTMWQSYRYIILPRAGRIILPPLVNEMMGIVKNSSVAFAVSVSELTMFALQVQEETARGVEVYLAVTGLYIISALAINLVMGQLERRVQVPGLAVPGAAGGGH